MLRKTSAHIVLTTFMTAWVISSSVQNFLKVAAISLQRSNCKATYIQLFIHFNEAMFWCFSKCTLSATKRASWMHRFRRRTSCQTRKLLRISQTHFLWDRHKKGVLRQSVVSLDCLQWIMSVVDWNVNGNNGHFNCMISHLKLSFQPFKSWTKLEYKNPKLYSRWYHTIGANLKSDKLHKHDIYMFTRLERTYNKIIIILDFDIVWESPVIFQITQKCW